MRPSSDLLSVVRGLDFQDDRSEPIRGIAIGKWPRLLSLTDEAQLTLPLAIRRRDCLPPNVRDRADRNLARNAQRACQTRNLYRGIAERLLARGVEFLVLKGMTHGTPWCDDLAHRPQFDLDLYCPPEAMQPAAETIASLGYEPVRPQRGAPADHLPAMIRRTGFQWKGDYYDPELPLIVELHFRFWNPGHEAFCVSGADGFRARGTKRNIGDCEIPALHPLDDLAYTTWHLVKHLLRGNLRLYHVYELAHYLDRTASANSFWLDWQASAIQTRVAEPIAFRLAHEWFGCRIHPVVRGEIERLPTTVNRWFSMFVSSPITGMEHPNKDELFLHLALAQGLGQRVRIVAHKLVPLNPPHVVMDAHARTDTLRLRALRIAFRVQFLLRRALRHIRAWSPIVQSGLRWWRQAWRAA
jgi:hypothetical protein